MAFAVICKSCQARFLLNDDLLRRKVAGRVVTVRCRQCHAPIEVDASNVDPKTVPAQAKLEGPAPAPPIATHTPSPNGTLRLKPTPAPPRPTKSSTLMGIGGPPRPAGATEMVALSPGFLSVASVSAAAPGPIGERGFPEPPPPPPAAVEELSSGDWEVTETPPLPPVDEAPESLDDFAEELPPSSAPPEEELPSSTGTPSLKALTHHDEHGQPKPRVDEFLANMTAAMNGGLLPAQGGAPTIDVSTLSTDSPTAPTIDVSSFDVPLTGKQTLPLFGVSDDDAATLRPPTEALPHAPKPTPPSAASSLRPASLEPRDERRPDSVRERKNVVAPSTKSIPPAAPERRRSGLAVPVLIAVAAAAGFLMWKRGGQAEPHPVAQAEAPAPEAAREPALPSEPAPAVTPSVAAASPSPAPVEEELTFETAKPSAGAVDKAASPSVAASSSSLRAEPSKPSSTESKPEAGPAAPPPAAKEEPKPEPKSEPPSAEPAGPFDRAAATAALNASSTQASACRKEGDPSGVASVVITFAPSGRVTSANVSGPPFAGTPTGGCIAAALRKAKVPPFEGDRVTVSKTIVVQ
jgi:hypothetical protein